MYDFWKICPAGNPTILVRAEDFSSGRAPVSTQLMDYFHAEQVGFIHIPTAITKIPNFRLDMMGGEFCLNATRAFALLLAQRKLLPELNISPKVPGLFKTWAGLAETSGLNKTVELRVDAFTPTNAFATSNFIVKNNPDHHSNLTFFTSITLPLEEITIEQFNKVWFVRLPGICHLITFGEFPHKHNRDDISRRMIEEFGLLSETAVGCMWLTENGGRRVLHPVVWVRDTGSLCQESSCGSGSLACALVLHKLYGDMKFEISQPSGYNLTAEFQVAKKNAPLMGKIGGPAFIIKEGKFCILEGKICLPLQHTNWS